MVKLILLAFSILMYGGCRNAESALEPAVQSRFISVEGKRVHLLTKGNGPAVVLLHGAAFSAETWKELGTISLLANAGYQVFATDLPGSGESESNRTSPGQWLSSYLDALKVDRPVIVSPSMSGEYSLPLVTSHPERVSAFVAVAPVGLEEYKGSLSKITVPVLAIWGEFDGPEEADVLVSAVKHGKKVVVPNAGHPCYRDNPTFFHAQLLKFLSEIKVGAGK